MTTDNFTEAANAAAREYARTPRMNVGTVQDRIGEAHANGWEAARSHLAAQEPTDAEVEAAAEALVFAETGEAWLPEHMPARIQRRWLSHARASLTAAKEATR